MKYMSERVIDRPQQAVWSLFEDAECRRHWQTGLESATLTEGRAGQPGAVSKLVITEKGRRVAGRETIAERREPHFLAVIHESKAGHTLVVNTFSAIDESRTKLTRWFHHRFRGAARLKSAFVAGRLRRQADDELERFKLLAESRETP